MTLSSKVVCAIGLLCAVGSEAYVPVTHGLLHRAVAVTRGMGSVHMEETMPNEPAALSEMEAAEVNAKLDALAEKWKRRQIALEDESAKSIGWVEASEQINGRLAMFFIIVGLVTEYYTGQSLPQQTATMLQTLGIIDL